MVDDAGNRVERGGGYLTLTRPWPSMLRGIYGDPERYHETYWSRYEGRYFAGDGCKLDDDGYLWLLGRVDDVMNVSGHRISTTEVESALVDHPAVAEAAVVGANDAVTGQAIMAYVIVRAAPTPSDELGEEVRQHVATKLGAIARPKTVIFTDELPKTRSGKIMRRLLRDVAEGRPRRHHHARRPRRGRGDQASRRRVTHRGVSEGRSPHVALVTVRDDADKGHDRVVGPARSRRGGVAPRAGRPHLHTRCPRGAPCPAHAR